VKFGVFDHIDESGLAIARQFEERLRLIERYERAGFHAYHLAEHHGTPLGHSPSPSVFLAAATQRTTTLRLGPLVYCLPLYHPLRLIDEVCMLDHLSEGRLQLGVGAGVSPVEIGFFGVDWDSRRERFDEAFEVLMKGFGTTELTHHGKYHRLDAVPITLQPVQRPHPPLWFGISNADRAVWAARHEVNVVALLPATMVRPITDRFREEWDALGRAPEDMPFMGVSRIIVLAETEDEAMRVARRAYRPWFQSLNLLWRKYGVPSPLDGVLPEDFVDWHNAGAGFAGTPDQARDYIATQVEEAGINYFAADLIFGDVTFEEASRTVELFEREVIPAFDPVAGGARDGRAAPAATARATTAPPEATARARHGRAAP
jgi:alkanesulfonate monooxygenase SsuD/methylene tetrahydromethanopterin reductase-like flavin-dependent oxidoreductase (luciferase family)